MNKRPVPDSLSPECYSPAFYPVPDSLSFNYPVPDKVPCFIVPSQIVPSLFFFYLYDSTIVLVLRKLKGGYNV
jgi:hypothetical protein